MQPKFLIKKKFVGIPYEEYDALEELLADFADWMTLRKAKNAEQDAPTASLNDVLQKYGMAN